MTTDELPSPPLDSDPILTALAAEFAALSTAAVDWRRRMPAHRRGLRNMTWCAEGRELLQRKDRLEMLARSYVLIDAEN